jgi:Helix-turn-helix domain
MNDDALPVAHLCRQLGLLTEEEVAAIAGADVSTVRNWRSQRSGPPFTKIGRRPLYRVEAFQEWLKAREKAADQ